MDGVNVLELGLSDLRRQVAVVPQETVLFNNTLGEYGWQPWVSEGVVTQYSVQQHVG